MDTQRITQKTYNHNSSSSSSSFFIYKITKCKVPLHTILEYTIETTAHRHTYIRYSIKVNGDETANQIPEQGNQQQTNVRELIKLRSRARPHIQESHMHIKLRNELKIIFFNTDLNVMRRENKTRK